MAACPYKVIAIKNRVATVNSFLCKGCGTCAGACRNKAISLIHFDDRQIVNEMLGALHEVCCASADKFFPAAVEEKV